MVWIHGGGFTSGSGNTELYGPDFLVAQDIILVTINYRLGILGIKLLLIWTPIATTGSITADIFSDKISGTTDCVRQISLFC